MLHSLTVVSVVGTAILPELKAVTVLQVVMPLALILGSIHVDVRAESVRLVLFPLSVKNVAVSVPKNSSTFSLAEAPPPFVLGAIWPDLDTIAVSKFAQPLALVDSSTLKSVSRSELNVVVFATLGARQLPVSDEQCVVIVRSVTEH